MGYGYITSLPIMIDESGDATLDLVTEPADPVGGYCLFSESPKPDEQGARPVSSWCLRRSEDLRRRREWKPPTRVTLNHGAKGLLVVMVVLAACGGTAPTTSSEPAAPSTSQTSPTSAPATTTHSTIPATTVTPTSAPTPTTIAPSAEPVGVLVANNSGIFFVPTGANPSRWPMGRCWRRAMILPAASSPNSPARKAARVWCRCSLPAARPGSSLLPKATAWWLEDVEVVGDNPTVVGTVHRGWQPQSERQELVTIDLVDGDRREVAVVGGYEAGGGPVSAEPNGFVLNKWLGAELGRVPRPCGSGPGGAIQPNPECVDDVTCPRSVVASADGARLAYLVTVPVKAWPTGWTWSWPMRPPVRKWPGRACRSPGSPPGVDIVGDLVLVNRLAAGERGAHRADLPHGPRPRHGRDH